MRSFVCFQHLRLTCFLLSNVSKHAMRSVHFLCFDYSNRFPSNVQRRKVWLANMNSQENWQPSAHSRICSDHLEKVIEGLSNIHYLLETQKNVRQLPILLLTDDRPTEIYSSMITGYQHSKAHNTYQIEQTYLFSGLYLQNLLPSS